MNYKLRDYQQEAVEAGLEYMKKKAAPAVIVQPTGCHAKGFEVLMFNGTVKNVEDVVVGDIVMGDNYTKRNVLELHRGTSMMYKVVLSNEQSFDVNEDHILQLYSKLEESPYYSSVTYTVKEFIALPKKIKKKHYVKQTGKGTRYYRVSKVIDIGEGDYYGFTLDKNNLFLCSNYYVHHNSGKSLVISNLAHRIDKPLLVLQPSKELLEQNYAKLVSFGGEASICSASMNQKDFGHMTYATIGTARKHVDKFKALGVETILVDEIDANSPPEPGSMFRTFIEELKPKNILGLTATPLRLKSYEGEYSQLNMINRIRPMIVRDILLVTQIQKMVEEKYWAKLNYELWDFDESTLFLNSTGAEYTEHSINRAIIANGVNKNIVGRVSNLVDEGKSCLVFVDSVENAIRMAELIEGAESVHAKTPMKERNDIVNRFKNREIKAIFNVGVFSIGFDAPWLDAVILGRPTNSFRSFYQWVGRVVRNPMYPEQKEALVIDFCNNVKRFGKIEDVEIDNYAGYGWGMTTNGRLLTGIPMGTDVMLEDVTKPEIDMKDLSNFKLSFGKHEGKLLSECPTGYLRWFHTTLDSFYQYTEKQKKDLKNYIATILASERKALKEDNTKIILIDFNNVSFSLLNRNMFHKEGLEDFITSLQIKFETTNVKLFKDANKQTYWRKKIYKEYKENREVKDISEKYFAGLRDIESAFDLGIEESLEADDKIADIVRSGEYKKCYVVSNDSDFGQLSFFKSFMQVNPHNMHPYRDSQQQAIHLLTTKVLKGDSSDNIKKSHTQKQVKSSQVVMTSENIYKRLLNFCKTGLCSDVNFIPLKTIMFEELSSRFDMDEELFNMNYDLICLIQNRRS